MFYSAIIGIVFWTLVAGILAFHVLPADSTKYRESKLERISDAWTEVAQRITIKKFRFEDGMWKEILANIERESKVGDTNGKGIELFIPEEFKTRFAGIANEKWTIQLVDGLDVVTIFSECPPHDWMYFPVEPRRIAVIPRDALIRDLTDDKK